MVAAIPLPGRAVSSASCSAGLAVLSSLAASTHPTPTGWHVVPRLLPCHPKHTLFLEHALFLECFQGVFLFDIVIFS